MPRLTCPGGRPGTDVKILDWDDDHARYPFSVTARARVGPPVECSHHTDQQRHDLVFGVPPRSVFADRRDRRHR